MARCVANRLQRLASVLTAPMSWEPASRVSSRKADPRVAGASDESVALLHDLMPGLLKPCCDAFHGDTSVMEM